MWVYCLAFLCLLVSGCTRSVTVAHKGEYGLHALDELFGFSTPVPPGVSYYYLDEKLLAKNMKHSSVRLDIAPDAGYGIIVVFNGALDSKRVSTGRLDGSFLRSLTKGNSGRLNVYEVTGARPEMPSGLVVPE